MKRLFDLFYSCIALIVFFLPAGIIALLLLLTERHSIFFMQERAGLHRKPFRMYKFRTMTDQLPTATGRILRRTGLDELPQFLNVLKGDMSIVGPRALTEADIDRLRWDDEHHAVRWHVRPGITGFAQLYGGQHRKASWFWDRYYASHNNLLLDTGVIAASFLMNIFGKTRVRRFLFQKPDLK
jgi:lipopolysaccharide/colanic/teichoic acid biosynthesis glycosyltransferase